MFYTKKKDLLAITKIWLLNYDENNTSVIFSATTRKKLREAGYSLSKIEDTLTDMDMNKTELKGFRRDFYQFYRDMMAESKMCLIDRVSQDTKGATYLLKALHGLYDNQVIEEENISLSDVILAASKAVQGGGK